MALAAGLVVVEPGARGRTLTDASGRYIGTAPAVIVDPNAGMRFLRANAGRIPAMSGGSSRRARVRGVRPRYRHLMVAGKPKVVASGRAGPGENQTR